MNVFLQDPAFVAAVVGLLVAIKALIDSYLTNKKVKTNTSVIADHEQQLNGGFRDKVHAAMKPDVPVDDRRAPDKPPTNPPKVQ